MTLTRHYTSLSLPEIRIALKYESYCQKTSTLSQIKLDQYNRQPPGLVRRFGWGREDLNYNDLVQFKKKTATPSKQNLIQAFNQVPNQSTFWWIDLQRQVGSCVHQSKSMNREKYHLTVIYSEKWTDKRRNLFVYSDNRTIPYH